MTVPFELLWGVDVAMKKLRPHAQYQLEGTNFTKWDDPTGAEPPTWVEIKVQIAQDQTKAELWQEQNNN